MAKRARRDRKLTPEEVARLREARAEFADKPSRSQVIASGKFAGPMSWEEYLDWKEDAGDVPLARQLQAAINAAPESLYKIAQGSGVAAPVLQRFMHGQRGITLETAGKVAAYLGLVLLPDPNGRAH